MQVRIWIHKIVLFSILFGIWHNAFAFAEPGASGEAVQPERPMLNFSISEEAARLSSAEAWSFTRINQVSDGVQLQLYVQARNNGLLVFNGERITYTIEIKNNTSQAVTRSNVIVFNQLPQDVSNKTQLDQISCINTCEIEYVTSTITTPLGRTVYITEPVSVKWAFDQLSLGANASTTLSFSGRVVGQYDGAVIENQAYMMWVDDIQRFMFSPKVRTIVLVPAMKQGELSVSNVPTWHSSDLGGTISLDWGDFDHDGYLDLALGSTAGVKVYRNQGGRLVPLSSMPTTYTLGVRWADVIPGGNLELVAVGSSINNSAVMSGTNYVYSVTNNEVRVASVFTSEYQLLRLEAGDVDRDGWIDLVVSNNAINTGCPVRLFKNNNGRFDGPGRCVVTNTATAAIALGDYNNDGYMDLALGYFPNQLVLINKIMTPTRMLKLDKTTTFLPYDLQWGDYDGDGDLDLAAAFPMDQLVRIYTNNPGDGFTRTHEFHSALFYTPLALDWVDFNSDGRLDLFVAGTPPVVYLNAGDSGGWFSNGHQFSLPSEAVKGQVWDLSAVDQDNDGDFDLALGNRDSASLLFTAFAPLLRYTLIPVGDATFSAKSVSWGDYDGDGLLDLAYGGGGSNVNSHLYLNQGQSFVLQKKFPTPQASVTWGNVNLDSNGRLDLVLGSGTTVRIYFDGEFSSYWQVGTGNWAVRSVALGDLEGDGDLDLLVATNGPNFAYLNMGTGLNSTPVWVSGEVEDTRSVAWADYDRDGYLDFAAGNYGGPVRVYRNMGSQSFALAWSSPARWKTTGVAWGDVNGDGYLDLAVGSDGEKNLILANDQGMWGGVLWESNEFYRTTALAFGDWDNDGDLDLAVGNYGQPDQVYVNRGMRGDLLQLDWIWQTQGNFSTTGVAWGDVDNDGDLDLAVSGENSGGDLVNGVYLNNLRSVPDCSGGAGCKPQMFNYPTCVLVKRPGMTQPAYFYSTPEILSGPHSRYITISYQLRDFALYTRVYTTIYEYSPDGGGTWKRATPGIAPSGAITVGNTPQLLNFVWDAWTDRVFSDNVLFRVTVIFDDPVGPVQYARTSAVSPPFRVSSNQCAWPEHPTIKVTPSNPQPNQEVVFEGTVSRGSGKIDFRWDLGDGTTRYGQVVRHTYRTGGRYTVTLSVASEPCPLMRVVTSTQQLIVGVGGYNVYLPLVGKSFSGGSAARASDDMKGTISSERLPNIDYVYGPDRLDAAQAWSEPSGLTQLESVIHAVVVTDVYAYTGCSLNNVEQPCKSFTCTNDVYNIYSQPAVNYDGKRVTFWSTANPHHTNPDQNIEVFVSGPITDSQKISLTQVTSSTGSVLGGFSLWPSLSADGTRLVMFSDQDLVTGKNRDQNFEIFVYDFVSSRFIQITETEECVNLYPSISADGRRVAYVSSCDGSSGSTGQKIVVVEVDQSGQVTRTWSTSARGYYAQPAISGNGRYVVFVQLGESATGAVKMQDLDTGKTIDIGDGSHPDVNYDGTRVVFVRDNNIFMARRDDSGVFTFTQITTDSEKENEQPSIDGEGNRVVYINRDGVWVYDWATRARTKLTAQKDVNSRPMIGDGGGHVVYASERQICYAEFPLVDLQVTKRSEKPSLVPGTPVTFTVVMTNRGPSDVVGAYITDTWGSFIQLQRVQCGTEVTNIITGNSTLTALLSLPAGTQTTCTFGGSLSSAASGTVTNCVQVSAPVGVIEHITTNNQSCDSHIPHPEANLVITKLAPYSRVIAGEKLTYTVYYTNNGPSNATQVYITDTLPVSTTFGAMLGPGGSLPITTSEGLVWWNIGTVTASTGGILTFTVLFRSDILTNTVLTNEVRITSGVTDPMTADNRSAFTVMVGTRSDLAITKFAEPDPVAAGSLLTYTLIFTNYGPSGAGNVCMTDTLPVSMTWKEQLVPAWTSSYTLSGNQVYWCGDLGRDISGTIRFVVTTSGSIAQPGVFTNVVSITHPSDTYTGNNTCRVGTNVHIPIDLRVRKVASSGQVSPGEPVTWTIWVTNTSSRFEVMSVTVSDSLPVDVLKDAVWTCQDSVINSSCGQISGSLPLSQTIAWLGAHGAVTYTIVGTVVPSMAGLSLVNTAFVTLPAGYVDPVPGDNHAQVTVTLSPKAELGVHKHAWPEPVVAGTTLTYTIVLTNAGPAYARPVTLTDHLTTAVQYGGMVAGNPPTVTGSTVVWRWDELCDHCTRTVQFTVTVRSDVLTGTQITNTAVVSSDAHDPVSNNSVAVSTGVHAKADLSVSKSASTENGVLTYTLVYTNSGPSYAREVYITDTLPVSVTWGGVATSSGGWTSPGTTSIGGVTYVQWYSPSLAVTTGTIVYTVTVNPGVSDGALLTNTVVIATDTPDPIAGNNWFTVTTMMPVVVDLSVSKSAMSDVVVAGELLTYTLILTNNNPSFGCHGVYVTDTLPLSVTVHEYTPSVFGSSVVSDAGRVAWHIPFLSRGVTGSITVVVLVGADVVSGTTLVNTVEITGCKDMVVTDNVRTISTTVHAVADLAVTKVGDGQVVAGDVLTYTLVYTNGGPSYAREAYITDTLPVSVTWGGVVSGGEGWISSVITSTGGVTYVQCYSASLAVTTGTIVYTVTVAPDVPDDVITNTVTITGDVRDEAVENNGSAITTTVSREADLAIVKQVDSVLTNSITYTLIYTNYGPSVANGIKITDTWDGMMSGKFITDLIKVLCSSPEGGKKIIICTIDHLSPGESGRITVGLGSVQNVMVTNLVSIASSALDPIDDNNHAMVTTTLQADLAITKSVESANPSDGVLTWTLSYANYGPLDASAVYITDTLPVSVTWGGVATSSGGWTSPGTTSIGGVTYVQWYSPSLAVTTGTIVYTVTVNPDVSSGDKIENTVEITSAVGDSTDSNNKATTIFQVARSDLFLVRNGLLRTLNTDLDLLAGNDRVENGNGQVSDGLPAGQAFANSEPLNRASFPEWPVVGPGGDKYARWFVGLLILCLLKI